ncbi:hypothetical protein FLONG3_2853 [Fusarium longipes]|uniref:Uncharacterized protein n=1 Tax=Fusarium longipes TaxID=694270 RepID=A0A395T2L3_9HYPO|nr:hypothetical protein FLONG3_2853 [Fusarium longipes]
MVYIRPFCALCEAAFQDGDDIAFITQDAQPLHSQKFDIAACMKKWWVKPGLINLSTSPRSRGGREMYMSMENDIQNEWSVASHWTCAEYLTTHGLSPLRAANVLAGDVALSRAATDRRRSWIRELAEIAVYNSKPQHQADKESLGWLSRLPLEITQQILQLSLIHIFISHANVFHDGVVLQPASYVVNVQGRVWASFVSFQGNYYVNCISHAPIDGSYSVLLRSWTKSGSTMYVAHDHLGIRRVVFDIPENGKVPTAEAEQGLWWETVVLTDDCQCIQVESDGIKLRGLSPDGEPACTRTYWASPMQPSAYPRIERIGKERPYESPKIRRMQSIALNDVGMRALSACFHQGSIVSSLIAHHPDLPGPQYGDWDHLSGSPQWLHFVLDEGEQITGIWGWKPYVSATSVVVVMQTSKGRVWTLGPQHRNWTTDWDHLIDLPIGEPSTIYFEESWTRVSQLAFKGAKPTAGTKEPPSEISSTVGLLDIPRFAFFFSASLTGVSTATPCWMRIRRRKCIVGLVLCYTDGRFWYIIESSVQTESTAQSIISILQSP